MVAAWRAWEDEVEFSVIFSDELLEQKTAKA